MTLPALPRSCLALTAFALAACSTAALSPLEVASLAQAEALWTAVGPTHYTLEMRLLCFCSDPVRAWTTIEVDHDTLVAVTFLTGDSVPQGIWRYRATVSGLFRLVDRERRAFRDIQMRFDQSTGYPHRLAFIRSDYAPHTGTTIEARNLRALDP